MTANPTNPTPWRINEQGGIVDANGAPVQRSRQIIVAAVNAHEGMRDALLKARAFAEQECELRGNSDATDPEFTAYCQAPAPDMKATLIESLRATLSGPQQLAFDALLKARGAIARSDLARQCGWEPTSGHVKNVVGSLSTLEIVEYPRAGEVALRDWVRK